MIPDVMRTAVIVLPAITINLVLPLLPLRRAPPLLLILIMTVRATPCSFPRWSFS